jgi:hypothetical protein
VSTDPHAAMTCPNCGGECWRDSADVGVGVMYGPWGCPCGWSEDHRFDVTGGPKTENGYAVDQWGGLTPRATCTEAASAQPPSLLPDP